MANTKKSKGRAGELDILIGQRIKAMRHINSLSQFDLATSLGITFQQIQKYENGQNRISAARLHEIAYKYKINYSFFFENHADKQQKDVNDLINNLDKETAELLMLFQSLRTTEIKKSLLRLLRIQNQNTA
jgi:transcriptional regulator with XRE-family HTH domain